MSDHLTIGEVAKLYATDLWRIRKIVDALGVNIPRAGLYRLVPRVHLAAIGAELHRRGWTVKGTEATPCAK